MSNFVTRRRFITSAVTASVTAAGAGAAACYGLVPPDHGGLFGVGETLTYAVQRVLLHRQPLAREFSRNDISKNFPATGLITSSLSAALFPITLPLQQQPEKNSTSQPSVSFGVMN